MTTQPNGNGNNLRVPWIMLLAFLLGLMGWGYRTLDDRKADKESVAEIAKDVREIRNFLMPPREFR